MSEQAAAEECTVTFLKMTTHPPSLVYGGSILFPVMEVCKPVSESEQISGVSLRSRDSKRMKEAHDLSNYFIT